MNCDMASTSIRAGHAGKLLQFTLGANVVTQGTGSTIPSTNGVKNFAIGMSGQKAWGSDRRRKLGGGEFPIFRIKSGMVYSFRTPTTCPEENIDRLGQKGK